MNICTSTLPAFTLADCVRLAAASGYRGVELRVHDAYHVSLPTLYHQHERIRALVERHGLSIAVYNTYYGIIDNCAVDTLIRICQRTGVRYFRVALPLAAQADVRNQALTPAIVPSYEQTGTAGEVLGAVKSGLRALARKTRLAGVTALVEIHWGTVMSSFTSAHYLLGDLDPEAVAVTFDPANMVIEGKEDWEYGVSLLRDHIVNVHVKNVSWTRDGDGWKWAWDGLAQGMVDWTQLFGLLGAAGYRGLMAMEDFRVPHVFGDALAHLSSLREETKALLDMHKARKAA